MLRKTQRGYAPDRAYPYYKPNQNAIMKTIYFLRDNTGFAHTAMMFTNKKAAIRYMENELKPKFPNLTFKVDFGYAFSK